MICWSHKAACPAGRRTKPTNSIVDCMIRWRNDQVIQQHNNDRYATACSFGVSIVMLRGLIMTRYRVQIAEVHYQGYIVDAENEKDAIDMIANGEGDMDEGDMSYHTSLPIDKWLIVEEPGDTCDQCKKLGENTCGNDADCRCFEPKD